MCASQQRQLFTAISTYTNDNDEHHHAVWDNNAFRFDRALGNYYLLRPYTIASGAAVQSPDCYWAQIYDPYLGTVWTDEMFSPTSGIGRKPFLPSWEVTRCPEATYTLPGFRTRNGGSGAIAEHDPYTLYSTLAFNGVTPGFDGIPEVTTRTFFEKRDGERVPRRVTGIEYPAEIIMYHDGSEVVMDGNGDTLVQLDQWNTLPAPDNKDWFKEYFRHTTCQVTWTDGHGSSISQADARAVREQLIRLRGSARNVPQPWYSTPNVQDARPH